MSHLVCISLLFFISSSAVLALPVLRVGMPVPGQAPYFWKDGKGDIRGVYPDTLRAITRDMGVELEFIALSQARLIRHFIAGEVDLELGVSRKINDPVAMAEVSLFSRPFGIINEVAIYQSELSFPAFFLKDLKGKNVATVRGAVIPDYIKREDFSSPRQIALRVHRGWNEIGLMREAVAVHYKTQQQLEYKISLPYESNPISIRLHRANLHFLSRINNAIEVLEKEGELEKIVCEYLCGQ